jgi:CheY-like chemotaxis protein
MIISCQMAPRPKLLCVDDEAGIRQSLERLLSRDFDAFVCESGAEALKYLKMNPDTAVVLSDFRMPVMSGL